MHTHYYMTAGHKQICELPHKLIMVSSAIVCFQQILTSVSIIISKVSVH